MFEKKKVGLVLGGGGARGLAHIGVLKVLEKNKIPIDMISGTSMGALIGALYSSESNAKKIEKEALEMKWEGLFDYTISKSGLIKGKKIEEFLNQKLKGMSFDDLKIPLYISAFDILNNQEIIFHKGDVVKAVRSSVSIPGVFIPTENNGKDLVDGGVVDPLPIEILKKKGAEVIIVVNVDSSKEKPALEEIALKQEDKKNLPNIFKILENTTFSATRELCKQELKELGADVVITPNVSKIAMLDFSKAKKVIDAGSRATKRTLKEIKKALHPSPIKEIITGIREDISKLPKPSI